MQLQDSNRVLTNTFSDILGIGYKVKVTLKDFNNDVVKTDTGTMVYVTANNTKSYSKTFVLSDLPTRTLTQATVSPSAGTYLDGQVITITNADAQAIYYSLDGTTPSQFNGQLYSAPIVLNASKTLKTVSVRENYNYSYTTDAYSIKCYQPTFSVEAGHTYPTTQTVALSSQTEDASIYYTVNGTTPTKSSSLYTTPLVVSSTTTIKAIAIKDGLVNSEVTSGTFTIKIPEHGVDTPDQYEVSIAASKTPSDNILKGLITFSATISPVKTASSYTWYLDGNSVGNTSSYMVNNNISDGYHFIDVIAVVDGVSYSTQYIFNYLNIAGTAAVSSSAGRPNNECEWVQLWKDGPKFAKFNAGSTVTTYSGISNLLQISVSGDKYAGPSNVWGDGWRCPSEDEYASLLENTTRTWQSNGYTFTGKGEYSENSIFIPAAGVGIVRTSYNAFEGSASGYYIMIDSSGSFSHILHISSSGFETMDLMANSPPYITGHYYSFRCVLNED